MVKLAMFILGSVSFMIKQYIEQYRKADLDMTLTELEPDLSLPRIQTYDFIIVGAGTSGCQLAGRVSQYFKVLLLEAGGNPPPAANLLLLEGDIIADTVINYHFQSKQQHLSLKSGGMLNISMGRMMGGSGSHNANFYNRGSPYDYDHFARITQDPSWSYLNVIQHFKRFEKFDGILVNENQRDFYGTNGPISVTSSNSPALGIWLAAGRELGFQAADSNAFQIEGFTPLAMSTKNGVKSSSYTSFIEGVERNNRNLRALRYSQVQKILINENKVAYGVTYLRHGIPQIAHASREVIISAGAVLSPIMLMKSGIGPANTLQSANIPIVQDLPGVGQNLMDHASIQFQFQILNPSAVQALNPLLSDAGWEDSLIKFQTPVRTGAIVENTRQQAFMVSSRAKRENEGTGRTIIFGAGTAGCLLAGRLSQYFKVLLLETGGNPPPPVNLLIWLENAINKDTLINYQFQSKQQHLSLKSGGVLNISMGKMMGGSGSHNGNFYNRGSPYDYDHFARITQDSSWSYSNVIQHFKRIENFDGILVNENQRGFAPLALSTKNGVKSSSYTALIEGVENTNPNLRPLRYSQVQKVLINENKVAYGVTYLRHGIPQIAHASREVIISAGAVLSPIMLMKSGIGPANTLQAAKIPIVQDLPGVGQNLLDHAAIHFKFQILNPSAAQALNPLLSESGWEDAFIKLQAPININVEFGRPKSRGCVILNTYAHSSGEIDDEKLVSLDLGSLTDPTDIDVLLEG
ncbi:Oxygen-dependent choline dehydrogenase [Folsomia candida]|uniref:Oxygen-dependent choline dehydrogenase n=1 Tax=Folsomia candida TaxID=158441 RepID=A0A226DKN7_FOLCA|nr:Oxygen-dependent choline dehydrogenase [Folsomia candida]